MGLRLHHSHGFLVVGSFAMHWATADQHLLSLVTFEAIEVLLVVHLLELMEAEMLLLHHLIKL